MPRWAIVVWSGLAVAAAALIVPGFLSSANRGSLFWILLVLMIMTGALAWFATNGDRRVRWLLVLSSVALAVLAIITAGAVLGLSLGQSPVVDVIGWPIVAVGALVVLLGSIWSLRSVEARVS